MIIYVDIDETICYYKGERNYQDAQPNLKRIEKINKMYDDGNKIVYWTARGSTTGLDWMKLTTSQLKKWNLKYHEL